MKLRTHNSKSVIGLDIGNSSIKAVNLSHNNATTQLLGYGSIDTPAQLFTGSHVLDANILKRTISSLVSNPSYGTLNSEAIQIALPAQLTYSKVIRMPKTKLREQKKQIDRLLQMEFSQSTDEQTFYSQKVFEEMSENNSTHELFSLTGISKHLNSAVIDSLSSFGARKHSIRASVDGLNQSLQAYSSNGPVVVIDFGYTQSRCYIFDSYAQLQKAYPKGSRDLINAMSQDLHIVPVEAHLVLKKTGIAKCNLGDKVRGVTKPILDYFCSEIVLSIAQYNEIFSDTKPQVSSIVLTGRVASSPGFAEYITRKTGLPTQVINPWKNLSIYPLKPMPKHLNPAYAGTIGLAMVNDYQVI